MAKNLLVNGALDGEGMGPGPKAKTTRLGLLRMVT